MRSSLATPLLVAAASLIVATSLRQGHTSPPDPSVGLGSGSARVLSLGRDSAHATALWMRTVDAFTAGRAEPRHIAAALREIGRLDPTWAEPWFFGILMLEDDAAELRAALTDEAAALHPEVPWFAWRAGMNRLGEDRDVALDWLRRAAAVPGADPAYRELLDALEAQR